MTALIFTFPPSDVGTPNSIVGGSACSSYAVPSGVAEFSTLGDPSFPSPPSSFPLPSPLLELVSSISKTTAIGNTLAGFMGTRIGSSIPSRKMVVGISQSA